MEYMLKYALAFDQCLDWDIQSSTTTTSMFFGTAEGTFACCSEGQWLDSSDGGACVDCPYEDACDGTGLCLYNFDGYACSICETDHFLLNDKCHKCPEWAGYSWLIGGFFAALVCWLIYRYSDGEVDLSTFTIATSFFQVTYIYFTFKLNYPDFVLEVVDWVLGIFSFAFVDLASPECAVGGSMHYAERWWVSATAPLIFMLPFVVKLCTLDRFCGFSRERSIHTLIVLLTITYVYAISTALEAWDCREYEDGKWRLEGDPTLECNHSSQSWQGLMAGSFFLFCGYFFGFNFLLLILFMSVNEDRESLYQAQKEELGFIFLRYKDEYRNWELVSNFRKFLTVVAKAYLSYTGVGQASMMIVVILFTLIAHVACDESSIASVENWRALEKRGPYRRDSSNALELRLLLLELLLVVFALIGKEAEMGDASLSGILLTIVGLGIALVLFSVAHGYLKQRRDEKENPDDSSAEVCWFCFGRRKRGGSTSSNGGAVEMPQQQV